jgi:prepilin-type N-terminal cleavage/methylation domain-containing protein
MRNRMKFIEERGFTLIDLMVTISIVAILASLSIPAYWCWADKVREAEVHSVISDVHTSQIAYYMENYELASTFDDLGFEIMGGERIDEDEILGKYYHYELNKHSLPEQAAEIAKEKVGISWWVETKCLLPDGSTVDDDEYTGCRICEWYGGQEGSIESEFYISPAGKD